MKKKKLILALDGIRTSQLILESISETLAFPVEMPDYVSHFKFNDAFHMEGFKKILPSIIEKYPSIGIFWDLKLPDTNGTDKNILSYYLEYMRPGDIVTVSSICSLRAFSDIRNVLPVGVEIAIVSVLTDTSQEECRLRRGLSSKMSILNDAMNLLEVKPTVFDAIICSPKELAFLKKNLPGRIKFYVPGVRDAWMEVGQQSKDRIAGIKKVVIEDGASGAVLGSQLMRGNIGKNITKEKSRELTLAELNQEYQDFLEILKNCDGYFNGKKSQLLVAYAGTYESPTGPKNKVGFEYFNFAKVESDPKARKQFGNKIGRGIIDFVNSQGINPSNCKVLGAPMGGILLAGSVSNFLSCPAIFAEKKVIALADKDRGVKEKSIQVIDRHEIKPGENIFIIEDVCNNFSTTEKLKAEIEKYGGNLLGIACAINRSGQTEWNGLPVISALFLPTEQYEQENPAVVDLIAQGKIIWKPKQDWATLKKAMYE